jgi:TonB family protein
MGSRMLSRAVTAIFLITVSGVCSVYAQAFPKLQPELRKIEGTIALIRNFYSGGKLRFDRNGDAINLKEGIWSVHGFLKVTRARIRDNAVLRVEGDRLAAVFDRKQKKMKLATYKSEVSIEVPITDDDDALRKLKRIFVPKDEDVSALVPPYWRWFFENNNMADLTKRDGPTTPAPSSSAVRVGGDVLPPKPIRMQEPSFSDFARQFRISGATQVQLVVDTHGEVKDLSIIQPLGAGLDEEAVAAISKWKFEPATRNGEPVAVKIAIDMDFGLFR